MDRGGFLIGDEPFGRVMLADLLAKPSRSATLESALPAYISDDIDPGALRDRLRAAVDELGQMRITPDSATLRSWADTR